MGRGRKKEMARGRKPRPPPSPASHHASLRIKCSTFSACSPHLVAVLLPTVHKGLVGFIVDHFGYAAKYARNDEQRGTWKKARSKLNEY
jgi:hypothetical protein